MNEIAEELRRFARLGWAVFPCHSISGGRCTCRKGANCTTPGKHPRTRNGCHDATTDPATIAKWWQQWPDANVAIATGMISGVAVLDIDPRHGGSVEDVEATFGKLSDTPMVLTGGGGSHYYFLIARPIGNRTGIIPGVDLRGDGGYVIAPPSMHLSGRCYCWELSVEPETTPLAKLPDWLRANEPTVTEEDRRGQRIPEETRGFQRITEAISHGVSVCENLETAIAQTIPTEEGRRNRAIFDFSRTLRGMADFKDADPAKLRDIVKRWHDAATPNTSGNHPFEDTFGEFLYCWAKVKFPKGSGPTIALMLKAATEPPPPEAQRYDADETRRLVAMCAAMQRHKPGEPFFIPTRIAAAIIRTDRMTIARRLRVLVADGLLSVAEKHTTRRCTRFIYHPEGNTTP
ncbi:MAG: bifunctional DNA primase/polymerase [Phycisphaerales bacterium]